MTFILKTKFEHTNIVVYNHPRVFSLIETIKKEARITKLFTKYWSVHYKILPRKEAPKF